MMRSLFVCLLLTQLGAGLSFTNPSNVSVTSVQLFALVDGGAHVVVYGTFQSDTDGGIALPFTREADLQGGGPAQTCALALLQNAGPKLGQLSFGFDGGAPP